MRRRVGHIFVEALFVLPLFLSMVLGFVDLARWELDHLLLWSRGRVLIRDVAMLDPSSFVVMRGYISARLKRLGPDLSFDLQITPVLEQGDIRLSHRAKQLERIDLSLFHTVRPLSPLFLVVNRRAPFRVKVKVHELRVVPNES